MSTENLVSINEFCIYHNAEISFVHSLQDSGLIEVIALDDSIYLHPDTLPELEKMTRLHYEMDINLEGIEAIIHLLGNLQKLNREIGELKGRLGLYE